MCKKQPLALLLAAFISVPAVAADTGFYGFASGGRTKFHLDKSGADETLTFDEMSSGYKLGGGYRLNRHLGLEAGWTDLGNANITLTGAVVGVPLVVTQEFKVKGPFVAAVLAL